jgi:hypothetical protein
LGEGDSLGLVDFFDLSAFGLAAASVALVSDVASVFFVLALSDFLVASSVLFFSLVLLVLGEAAGFSAAGLVFVADSAGLFAVEAGAAVALTAGLVVAGVAVAGTDGEAFAVALAAGVMVAAAVAPGVDVAATLAVATGVAAGVALAVVDALVLEVVVPDVEVTPRLKVGVTP